VRNRKATGFVLALVLLSALGVALRPQPQAPASPAGRTPQRSTTAAPPAPRSAPARDATAAAHSGPAAGGIIGSGWRTTTDPAFAAFREWTARYLAADPAEQARLLAEGLELARARREVLAALIRSDARAALAAAIPMTVRQQLPAAVVSLLEKRVSGLSDLSLLGVTAAPGRQVAEPTFRSTLIDGEEYRAYVYGRRADQATVASTSIVGISVDHALAVSESPLRVLEAGEKLDGRAVDNICPVSGRASDVAPDTPLNLAAPTAVEYNGTVHVLCHEEHIAQVEKLLFAAEQDHLQTAADSQPGSSGVTGRPTSGWTHGTKKVLIIRVDFSDLPGTPVQLNGGAPITPDVAVNLFNAAGGVGDFYTAGSYSQTALQITATVAGNSVDVTPVLRLPSTAASYATANNNDGLHADARAAALAQGYDEANYDRVGVVFSTLGSISGSQITYGGLGQIIGKYFWVSGEYDLRVVAHEIGHNYGLNHANLWQVSDGNPVSPAGSSTEYGDPFDVMGGGSTNVHHFTHWNKSILQWIPDSAVTLGATAGTYRIFRFDPATAPNLANPRVLKVVRDATTDYWIGYRRATANASLNGGAYVLWGYNTNKQANLLDLTTPGTDPTDAGLAIGTTFNDSAAGITLKPVAQGGSGTEEYLDVQVGFQPRIQWSLATYVTDEQGGSVVLTLTRGQNSTGAVSVNYSTAAGSATSPADFAAQSGTVTWADGDMSAKTITIPIVAGANSGGTQNFTVNLSSPSGGVVVGGSSATVTIADPGVRDPSFTADFVNNTVRKVLPLPDGSMILGGSFSQVYDAATNAYARHGVARLYSAGTFDPSFATGGGIDAGVVYDLARQPDGKIIAVGSFTAYNGTARSRLARLNSDGSLDATFSPGTGADGSVYAVLVQPDGKVVIGGGFTNFNGTAREYLARLNPDGSVDSGFVGPNFAGTSGWEVRSLAMQADGKILVGGVFYFTGGAKNQAGLCRVTTSGALDATFNGVAEGATVAGNPSTLSRIYHLAVQPDGKILIAGEFSAYNNVAEGGLARLTSTGALDGTFTAPTFDGTCYTVLLTNDGRLLVGGDFTHYGATAVNHLARLSGTGALDPAFNAAGGYGMSVYDLELLAGGRVLLGGDFGSFQSSSTSGPIWQLVPGLPGPPGTVQFASPSYHGHAGSTAVLSVTRSGGSLGALTVGYTTVPGSATTTDFTATSGTLTWADGDAAAKTITVPLTAASPGAPAKTFTVNLGPPLIGGVVLGSIPSATVSVLDGAAVSDFNVDGHTDLLWENTAGVDRAIWYLNGTGIAGFDYLAGIPNEWRIVGTADFDHDGYPDILWENTATGDRSIWLMNGIAIANFAYLAWVDPSWHIAALGDFNGDGNVDVIWENAETGGVDRAIWYLNGTGIASFGYLAGIPPEWKIVGAGDFNGDGQTDLVWEDTSTGQRSIWLMNGVAIQGFGDLGTVGTAWHIAMVADFNGDGKSDLLWENRTTGDRAIWLMNGTTHASSVYLAYVDPVWHIAP